MPQQVAEEPDAAGRAQQAPPAQLTAAQPPPAGAPDTTPPPSSPTHDNFLPPSATTAHKCRAPALSAAARTPGRGFTVLIARLEIVSWPPSPETAPTPASLCTLTAARFSSSGSAPQHRVDPLTVRPHVQSPSPPAVRATKRAPAGVDDTCLRPSPPQHATSEPPRPLPPNSSATKAQTCVDPSATMLSSVPRRKPAHRGALATAIMRVYSFIVDEVFFRRVCGDERSFRDVPSLT